MVSWMNGEGFHGLLMPSMLLHLTRPNGGLPSASCTRMLSCHTTLFSCGVEHFRADRYLHIVKEEGLEISQPALDPHLSSQVRNKKTRVHSWVEMMAPVFSRAAWKCAFLSRMTWYIAGEWT